MSLSLTLTMRMCILIHIHIVYLSLYIDFDAGRDWGQEDKETTEDEMAGWHH